MRVSALMFALSMFWSGSFAGSAKDWRIEVSRAGQPELRAFYRDSLVLVTPVAVGMGENFCYRPRSGPERCHRFETPRGTRYVLRKEKDPFWIAPLWHYDERARQLGLLDVVVMKAKDRITLSNGEVLTVRDDLVGKINRYGNFVAWPLDTDIIEDGKIFVPPPHTDQARVSGALGPAKLDLGNGYLIHGVHEDNSGSIGRPVTHGCIRMANDKLLELYALVPTGTPVVIN